MRLLTEKDAKLRSESVLPGIEYDIYLNLLKGTHYKGFVRAKFCLKQTTNVFLDFFGEDANELKGFKVNQNEWVSDPEKIKEAWDSTKLRLKSEWLQVGFNTIDIKIQNDYGHHGNGLHFVLDVDQKQYLYSQTEPYNFNQIVPAFDQPDLKAYARFYFMHPKDWIVASNTERQVQFTDLKSEFLKGHDFLGTVQKFLGEDFESDDCFLAIHRKTKRLSSYLFCVVAGPYQCIELPKAERYRDIPMSIYFRKSLEEFAVPLSAKVFEVSKKGLEFYENFFGHPYPFSKWDTAFCPEFTVGAMEYPGIVTYSDSFIFKEKNPPRSRISYLVMVILHEMAHMWFGDYVTMRWWDGLWLNESFAEFMNFKSLSEIQGSLSFPTDKAWSMMNECKNWGYRTDANSNTHAIQSEVANTEVADAIFDGITYSKGASVIQQLYYLIGDKLFRENIKNYFEEFKWKNTELDDLLRHLEKDVEGLDLKKWKEEWLMTAGTNTVLLEWDHAKQGKQTLKIHQGALLEQFATLRRHKLDIAFYKENGEVGMTKKVDVLNQPITEIEFENDNFQAVMPNSNDWTFIAIKLDEKSREYFIENMSKLDELTFLLVMRSLYNDVTKGKVKADVFINVMMPNLQKQLENPTLIKELGGFISSAISYIPYHLQDKNKKVLFSKVWELMTEAQIPTVVSELKKISTASMSTAEDVTKMYETMRKRNEMSKKVNFDERQQAMVTYLTSIFPNMDPSVCKEAREFLLKEAETKEFFKKRKYSLEAFDLSTEAKIELWEKEILNKKRSLSYVHFIYTLLGFSSKHNSEEQRKMFVEKYFAEMPAFIEREEKQFIESFLNYGMPYWEDSEFELKMTQELYEKVKHLSKDFAKNELLSEIDEIKERIRAYSLYK